MSDLREFLKKNREYVLLGVAFVVLLMVGIYLLVSDQSVDPMDDSTFNPSIEEDQDSAGDLTGLSVSNTATIPDVTEAKVYTSSVVDVSDVETIVGDLGLGSATRTTSDDGLFQIWIRGDDFIRYNTETGDMTLNSAPISLVSLDQGYLTLDESEDYLKDFVQTYLGIDYDMSVIAEASGDQFRVVGTWRLGGYDVVTMGGQEQSVVATFTQTGALTALYVNLVEFDTTEETIDLVSMSQLQTFLQYNTYPSASFLSAVPAYDDTCEECDPYGWYTSEDFTAGEIDDVGVVYYVNPSQSSDVLPVYRLEGDGTVLESGGVQQKVSIVIYANAIDPSRIITSE